MTSVLDTGSVYANTAYSELVDDPLRSRTVARSLYEAQDPTNRKPLSVEFAEQTSPEVREVARLALGRINRLRALPPGWDGKHAQQVTDEASVTGVLVVASVTTPNLTAQIFPLPDGGLQAEWHYHDWDLEIEISDNGELSVYASDDAGQVTLDIGAADVYEPAPLAHARQFLQDALHLYPRPAQGAAWR